MHSWIITQNNKDKPSTVYQIQTWYNSGSKLSDKKCIVKDLQSHIKTHKKNIRYPIWIHWIKGNQKIHNLRSNLSNQRHSKDIQSRIWIYQIKTNSRDIPFQIYKRKHRQRRYIPMLSTKARLDGTLTKPQEPSQIKTKLELSLNLSITIK